MKRILIVDDDETVLSALKRSLRKHYEIAVAFGGESALRELGSFQPDLVIADAIMPGMKGVQLLGEVRQRLPSCKLMVLTGTTQPEELSAIDALPDVSRAWKPWNNNQLLAQLNEILR